MAGSSVNEKTMPASTPKAEKRPKICTCCTDETASEASPAAVVSDVITTGGVICSMVARTHSATGRSGCSAVPSMK